MEERRFQPRQVDACDESVTYDYIDGERSRMEQGGDGYTKKQRSASDGATNLQEVIELLQVLKIDPDRFKGVFQQEHQPCPSWNKHIYEHLKREKASRVVTKPKPEPDVTKSKQERLRHEKQSQGWGLPKTAAAIQNNMVKPGVEQSGMGMFLDPYGDEPAGETLVRHVDPIGKRAVGQRTQAKADPVEVQNTMPQTTPIEHAERNGFLIADGNGFTIAERYKKPKPKPIGPAERDGFMIAEQYTRPNGVVRLEAIENVGGRLAGNEAKVVTLSTENAPWRKLNHMCQGPDGNSTLKDCVESFGQLPMGGYVV